jgi:hypothetical protein
MGGVAEGIGRISADFFIMAYQISTILLTLPLHLVYNGMCSPPLCFQMFRLSNSLCLHLVLIEGVEWGRGAGRDEISKVFPSYSR